MPDVSGPNAATPLPEPSLSSFLTIGFNSTTRHLHASAQYSKPSIQPPDVPLSQAIPVSGFSRMRTAILTSSRNVMLRVSRN